MTRCPDSLSIVLPVQKGALRLAARVSQLLDLLPDCTHQFEIVILDDCSTDLTGELADELARDYPQVRVLHIRQARTEEELVQTAFQVARGELVVVYDEDAPIRETELQRMWRSRKEERLVIARPGGGGALVDRLTAWAARVEREAREQESGFQVIARRTKDAEPENRPRPSAVRAARGRRGEQFAGR